MERNQHGMSVKYQYDNIDCGNPRNLKAASTPFEKENSAPSCISRLISKMHHILCPSIWKAGHSGVHDAKIANDVNDQKRHSRSSSKRPQDNFQHKEKAVSSFSRQPAIKKTQEDTNDTSIPQRSATGPARSLLLNGSAIESIATATKSIDSEAVMREAQCVIFHGDEDSDYTRGPIRIIAASDGVDDNCAVLLLNRKFSDSIKAAISARRELVKFIQTSQEQDQAAELSRRKVRETIERYRLRIVTLEAEATDTNMKKAVAHALEREMREIHAKIDELEKTLYAEAREQSIRENSLQLRYKDCFKVHEAAHQFLEAAFVDARISSPLPIKLREPIPRNLDSEEYVRQNGMTAGARRAAGGGLTKQRHEEEVVANRYSPEEYAQKRLQQPTITEGTSSIPRSRSTSNQHSETTEPPETSNSSHLRQAYTRAKQRLNWAQREFDLRDETREHEQYWNDRDLRRSGGTEGLPQEQFDLLWVEHISKLTRALIDAEEAFKTARTAAVSGGCQLDDPDASSVFEDEDDEGYPPSREAIMKANAPKGMIEGWRKSVADKSGFPDTSAASAELDSRDGDETDLWGSWSVVADPPRQGKIRQWEKACTAADKKPVI